MNRLLTILLLLGATAHGQINNPPTPSSIGLGWSALTNPQSSLYSGTATQLLGYVAETNTASPGLTGFNVLAYTNTNGLVIPANILIGEDQTSGGPRNARNVTVNGAVTIQYPYSSPTTIYGNNSILATDASTYTNTLATWNSNTVTFATNVSVAGSLSVGSLTTTTPSTWALDATQTAAATNGILALPSNANVIRLTNNNAISSVTNGVLGAFYFVVNQATNAVTISNVGGITVDGAQNLTLSPNESATLVVTGATNASVAARGDLTDVALGGTANTAPSQTASSASSLMTRELTDINPLWAVHSIRTVGAYLFGNSGTGSTAVESATVGGAQVNNGTSTNGYGRATLYRGITTASGITGTGINFARDISFGGLALLNPFDSSHAIRLIFGGNGGVPAPADSNALTTRGFGVEFVYSTNQVKARLFANDGTNYTTSSLTTFNHSSLAMTAFVVRSDGTGNVSLHINSSSSAAPRPPDAATVSITGGPNSSSGAGQYIDFVAVGNSTGTNTSGSAGFFNGYIQVK